MITSIEKLITLDITEKQLKHMLVPGDRINISILNKDKIIKIYDSAIVIDILNDNGISIFDVYYKLFELSKEKQEELLFNSNFQKNIGPAKISLKVIEMDSINYNSLIEDGLNYEITLLNEIEENIILKALSDLKKRYSDN
ncbi:TPA: hypothetical protein KQG29_001416 [Clostridioides difficile]|nr:hypothetical protein [Clostridioides difficile]